MSGYCPLPAGMTPRLLSKEQIRLMRHALGLTYSRRSYRNRFCARNGTPDWRDWRAIVNAGLAWRIPWGWSGGDFFYLSRAGAQAVLRRDERLDREDFPP